LRDGHGRGGRGYISFYVDEQLVSLTDVDTKPPCPPTLRSAHTCGSRLCVNAVAPTYLSSGRSESFTLRRHELTSSFLDKISPDMWAQISLFFLANTLDTSTNRDDISWCSLVPGTQPLHARPLILAIGNVTIWTRRCRPAIAQHATNPSHNHYRLSGRREDYVNPEPHSAVAKGLPSSTAEKRVWRCGCRLPARRISFYLWCPRTSEWVHLLQSCWPARRCALPTQRFCCT
jgi:hypothetical protein